jgi:hypothetical protein
MNPGRLAAFRSLAKSRGVDLATVVAAAERGDLRRIVEMRAHGKTLSPGRPGWRAKTEWQALDVLKFKKDRSL